MKKSLSILLVFVAYGISTIAAKEAPIINGSYIGWKVIEDRALDDGKNYPSYELQKMRIKDGIVTINTAIRTMNDKIAWSSASGPFTTIEGKFYYEESKLKIKMQVKSGEYILDPDGGWPGLDHEVTIHDHTRFSFGGITYTLVD